MNRDLPLTHSDSVHVDAAPAAVYDLVSDQTRVGEWSPQCVRCEWEDPAHAGEVGAVFVGHNETADRSWSTRSTVVVADRPREFAWEVGPGLVRWAFEIDADGHGSRLTESWRFLDDGLAMFRQRYGEDADAQVADRTQAAHAGIPRTLEAIKHILER
ncbi:SRPBCC family protein [Nocardioidaceae bacterium]|nr:SRPBCC family protein [Nocardioidaceae bacterium]